MNYYVTNFYAFSQVSDLEQARLGLHNLSERLHLRGLVILAPEGINGTLVVSLKDNLDQAKDWITQTFKVPLSAYKDSQSSRLPFRHALQVRIRPEIVTLKRPELVPGPEDLGYLTPEQWDLWLKNDPSDYTLIDARNDYEYRLGTFRGALNPKTEQFTEFPDAVEYGLKADKEKPLLMFCTGGIRCEKAALELRNRGYKKVHQLHGGILRYLEKFPHGEFKGECFIFDDRVALDQELKATTRYVLCVHCGCPADVPIVCKLCGKTRTICADCRERAVIREDCSKNCAHHLRKNSSQSV